jgi:hypothetical protein
MKTNKFYFLLFFGLLLLSSCDKGFEEMNENPNSPTTVPSSLLIPQVTTAAMNNMYSTFVGGDMGACWSQQISKVQYNDEERFYPRTTVINGFWDGIYLSVIADADAMYKLAVAEGNNNMQGVALTLKAYGFLVLTDTFGDIPFSEALSTDSGIISPKYDSQADVYTGCLAMLDDAAALLGTGGTINATSDVIYGGDAGLWEKFANSLKFRSLMRISGKVDVSAQLQALYNGGMMFTSNDEEAKLVYLSAQPNANPIYETIVYGTRNEFKACSTLTNLMAADPRLPVYFAPIGAAVVGKVPGVADVPSPAFNYTNVSAVGAFYLRPEAPGYFMSYAELEFLIAEASMKSYITGANAATHYANGITASFAAANNTPDAASTIASSPVSLVNIYNQKYIALYWQGIEAWTEQRRTGYPLLQVVQDANPSVSYAKRYYYNSIESSINATNYQAAVANQGADLLSTKVWWMP